MWLKIISTLFIESVAETFALHMSITRESFLYDVTIIHFVSFFSSKKDGRKYLQSVLSIPKVTAAYLYTNLTCKAQHPAGSDSVRVILIPGELYVIL